MPFFRLPSHACFAAILFTVLTCFHPQARADINGFGNGAGFSLNSGVTVNSGTAKLTDGGILEARSIFYGTRQSITAFDVSFVYQENATVIAAGGGFAFVIQGDSRGTQAVGQSGTMLGYGGGGLGAAAVSPSASVQVNLVNIAGLTASNTGFGTNGALTTNLNAVPGSTNLGGGDSIRVVLHYNGSTLTETLTDTITGVSSPTYTYNAGNLSALLGSSTAYVGFTGGTGLLSATQTVSDFSFVAVPEYPGWGTLFGGGFLALSSYRLYRRLRLG